MYNFFGHHTYENSNHKEKSSDCLKLKKYDNTVKNTEKQQLVYEISSITLKSCLAVAIKISMWAPNTAIPHQECMR